MKSKSNYGQASQNWYLWLRMRKQRLAAFTVLLMLALGLITNRPTVTYVVDREQGHIHVESHSPDHTTLSSRRRIPRDSGATAVNADTDTIALLARLGHPINVAAAYDIGSALR